MYLKRQILRSSVNDSGRRFALSWASKSGTVNRNYDNLPKNKPNEPDIPAAKIELQVSKVDDCISLGVEYKIAKLTITIKDRAVILRAKMSKIE